MSETYSTHRGMRNAFIVCCEILNIWDCLKNSSVESTGLFISPSGISELDCATTKIRHGIKEHINR